MFAESAGSAESAGFPEFPRFPGSSDRADASRAGKKPSSPAGMRSVGWASVALVLGIGCGVALHLLGAPPSRGLSTGTSIGGSGAVELQSVSAVMYVVQPGDTLWSIVHSIDPTGDERPLVDKLVSQLHGSVVYPGEQVEVPAP